MGEGGARGGGPGGAGLHAEGAAAEADDVRDLWEGFREGQRSVRWGFGGESGRGWGRGGVAGGGSGSVEI